MTEIPKTWLTPTAHLKLTEEYKSLTQEGREAIRIRIAEAREHGDLRENAEYDTAKNDQGLMEARIREIRYILDNCEVSEATNSGSVEIGTIATVRNDEGEELDIFIAATHNKDTSMLLASPDSPLGSALLGANPGSTVTFKAPGGSFEYEVLSIRAYED